MSDLADKRAFYIDGAWVAPSQPHYLEVIDPSTEEPIAVISLGGIVVSESLRVAGNEFDESIIRYVRRKHNVLIGERTAEEIKMKVGAAMLIDDSENLTAEVRGRDLGTAPEVGDARLLVAATIGGVRLIDNVGLPLGIGFNNIEEHEAKAELEREQQRAQGTASQQPSED